MQALAPLFLMGMSAYASYAEGEQVNEVSRLQRDQLYSQAEETQHAGQVEAREKRKEGQRLMAQQVAQAGAQGGTITGSALSVLAETAGEIESDATMIQRNAMAEADQLRMQGDIYRYAGRTARRTARIRGATQLTTNIVKYMGFIT